MMEKIFAKKFGLDFWTDYLCKRVCDYIPDYKLIFNWSYHVAVEVASLCNGSTDNGGTGCSEGTLEESWLLFRRWPLQSTEHRIKIIRRNLSLILGRRRMHSRLDQGQGWGSWSSQWRCFHCQRQRRSQQLQKTNRLQRKSNIFCWKNASYQNRDRQSSWWEYLSHFCSGQIQLRERQTLPV